jgi:starvation-inducible DNA-binding protein
MSTVTLQTAPFKRSVLQQTEQNVVAAHLQDTLVDLVDLSLVAKQAHWNVTGRQFTPVHEFLDEVTDSVRDFSDEVAERCITLGVAPDGRVQTVAADTQVEAYPDGVVAAGETVTLVADRLAAVIERIRHRRAEVADHDAATEDLFIEILRDLEKKLWMLQAQEK